MTADETTHSPAFAAGPSPAATRLGRLGVWSNVDHLSGRQVVDFGRRVEALGFDTLWIQEGAGREPFALLGGLAGATDRVTLAVGIASIYARDAAASHAGALTVDELSGGRFVLGLGVSHAFRVEEQRGHAYLAPLPTMRAYLEAYAAAPYQAPRPVEDPPIVLAALRERMLGLAATATDGAFPYFVPAGYVGRARAMIDRAAQSAGRTARPALIVSLAVLVETNANAARAVGRRYTEHYVRLPNYRANLLESGFDESDLAGAGSDRLVDEVVAWGDVGRIQARIDGLYASGADHVAIIPLGPDGRHAHVPALEALGG